MARPQPQQDLWIRWWRLSGMTRSTIAVLVSVLALPALIARVLGDSYLWLVVVACLVGMTVWWVSEQPHRRTDPG